MTTNTDFDRDAAAWLAEGPNELADRVLDAALAEVHLTSQRRRWSMPWRLILMPTYVRPAAGIAVAAILAVGLISYVNRSPGVGAQATSTASMVPSPSLSSTPARGTTVPAPTHAPIDTTGWTTYTSEQYGFTLAHPADWTAHPATRPWTFSRDGEIDPTSNAMDSFVSPDNEVAVSFWTLDAATLSAGTLATIDPAADIEAWAEEYCRLTSGAACDTIRGRATPMCLEYRDCHPALVVPFGNEMQAYFTNGAGSESVVIAVIWRGELDPKAAPFGGSRLLLEQFLSTIDVWPVGYLPFR
ncbi:MAG: hypothetical protein ABI620_06985 [Chloroflexota bacterium]